MPTIRSAMNEDLSKLIVSFRDDVVSKKVMADGRYTEEGCYAPCAIVDRKPRMQVGVATRTGCIRDVAGR